MHINQKLLLYTSAIAAVLIYGTAGSYILGQYGNFNVPITNSIEALYFTITTISTVGYGDIVPVTNIGRVFTIILIISGLTIFLSAVTVLSSDFLSERVEKLYSGLSRVEKRHLKNHIILVGYGPTNTLIAEKLKSQRRNFIIITSDKTNADTLRDKGYVSYLADYTQKIDMEKFRFNLASDIILDINESTKAVYVVLVIKKLAQNANISVIAYSQDAASHFTDLEVAHVINPVTIAAEMMVDTLDKDQDARNRK
jgi:voltage-gated potassium channel